MASPDNPKDCPGRRRTRQQSGRCMFMAFRVAWALFAICGTQPGVAQPSAPSENQVKAAFLINFPKYVVWPPGVIAQPDSPIIIATLGESGVAEELSRMVAGKTLGEHPITFKVLSEIGVLDCHILFIPDVARRHIPDLLESLKQFSILTVGESDGFLEQGGMINLVRRDRKIRLQVNLEATKPAGVKLSSKLLSVADVVRGK